MPNDVVSLGKELHPSCSGGMSLTAIQKDLVKHLLWHTSLALPSYVLLLNLDFASVLGLAIRYVSQILQVDFLPANQLTEGVAENDDVDVVRKFVL